MGLWLYEDQPFSFALADEETELVCELIRRCGPDCDAPCCAEVVDLAAVRSARGER